MFEDDNDDVVGITLQTRPVRRDLHGIPGRGVRHQFTIVRFDLDRLAFRDLTTPLEGLSASRPRLRLKLVSLAWMLRPFSPVRAKKEHGECHSARHRTPIVSLILSLRRPGNGKSSLWSEALAVAQSSNRLAPRSGVFKNSMRGAIAVK